MFSFQGKDFEGHVCICSDKDNCNENDEKCGCEKGHEHDKGQAETLDSVPAETDTE